MIGGKSMRNRLSSILWGTLFIIAGIGFVGNAFNIWNFELFFDGWWTLFIIIPSGISIIQNGPKPFAVCMFVIGVLILLSCIGIFDYSIIEKLLLPIIFIIIGVSIIGKSGGMRINKQLLISDGEMPVNTAMREYAAVFSTQSIMYNENEVFEGVSLNSIFGGMELDLRSCIINQDVVIDTTAIFGGMDIFLPKDVNVKVSSTPIFGGVSNKTRGASYIPGVPTVYINAVCMFGGVDIK